MDSGSSLSDVGQRAQRRIAWRLLPFLFVLYFIAYLDRVNVGFAGLDNYLTVITAQSVALANQKIAVNLLTRRMTSSVLLVKALGGGWDVSKLTAVD